MLLILKNIVVLVVAALVSWWLSWYDPELTGKNEIGDRIRRGVRCGLSVLLIEAAFGVMCWNSGPLMDLGFILPLTLIWCGFFYMLWRICLMEALAIGFCYLFDSGDNTEFDPQKRLRDLDAIALLIKSGNKKAAIQLCNELKASGDASVQAMETMLEHLGVPQPSSKIHRPLAEASALRLRGHFGEAELILNSLLLKNPRDVDAAIMLTRLYAQDLRQPNRAEEVLCALEQQPHISKEHIDFARRSIHEWSQGEPAPEEAPIQPESPDELLAKGHLGTAIEILEQKTQERPQDFDLWMKLAEVYAVRCGNVSRAEKIVRRIETNPAFSPEQIQITRAKLKEWREAKSHRN